MSRIMNAGASAAFLAVGACAADAPAIDFSAETIGAQPRGDIVYVSEVSGNPEVWIVRRGGAPRQLTDDPRADYQPALSPDGKRIVWSRVEDDGRQNLWLMDVDGGRARQLTTSTELGIGDPRWSPDGRTIAVTMGPLDFSHFDVGVVDAADGDVRSLTAGAPGDSFGPDWSPDGKRLAFSSSRLRSDGGYDLFTMHADGNDVRRVIALPDDAYYPKWSPDGDRLAFGRDGADGLWTVGTRGEHLRAVPNTGAGDSSPEWSPDGDWLAFVRWVGGTLNVYVIRADGEGGAAPLDPSPAFEYTPDWGR